MNITFRLDVLKPHSPDNEMIVRTLMEGEGITYAQIKTDEIDEKTTSVFLTIKGSEAVTLASIKDILERMNCALHSVDEVIIER